MRGLKARLMYARGMVAAQIYGHGSDEAAELFDGSLGDAYVEGYVDFLLGCARFFSCMAERVGYCF